MAKDNKAKYYIFFVFLIIALAMFFAKPSGRADCVSQWSCSNWGSCVNGTQTRNCGDLNECEIPNPLPVLEQECQLCQPSLEICDGVDNDCDGLIDEDLRNSDSCYSKGLCAGSYRTCDEGEWSECTVMPTEDNCDGIDNDCDGLIDEDLYRSCIINTNVGIQQCIMGAWRTCEASEINTFSCNEYQCVPDVNGQYNSQNDCQTECICEPHWTCSGWSEWSNKEESCGTRSRTCDDTNECAGATYEGVTEETKACPEAVCGNSILEQGEFCDGQRLNGKSCMTLGYDSGTLKCNDECTAYDKSDCKQETEIIVGDLPEITYYSCDNNYACVEDDDGKYLTNECGGICKPPIKSEEIEPTTAFSNEQILIVGAILLLLIVIYGSANKKK